MTAALLDVPAHRPRRSLSAWPTPNCWTASAKTSLDSSAIGSRPAPPLRKGAAGRRGDAGRQARGAGADCDHEARVMLLLAKVRRAQGRSADALAPLTSCGDLFRSLGSRGYAAYTDPMMGILDQHGAARPRRVIAGLREWLERALTFRGTASCAGRPPRTSRFVRPLAAPDQDQGCTRQGSIRRRRRPATPMRPARPARTTTARLASRGRSRHRRR